MGKAEKAFCSICMIILLFFFCAVSIRTFTRQVLVKYFGINNSFTNIILFDVQTLNDVNEATENMILANAQMLKDNTEKTTKLLENPSISIEKLQKAYQDIYTAIETQEASSRRVVASSKEFVAKLEDMNKEMKTKLLNQ